MFLIPHFIDAGRSKLIMIGHQAVRMDVYGEPFLCLGQIFEKLLFVAVPLKDVLDGIATVDWAVPVISKQGKAALRYALVQAATIAAYKDDTIQRYFARLLRGAGTRTRHQTENEGHIGGQVAGGGP